MHSKLPWALLVTAVTFSGTAFANEMGEMSQGAMSHKTTSEKANMSTDALAQMTQGEIRKIDGNKVTIKHRAPNDAMSAMTMTFAATDPALLRDFKAGDKVRFTSTQQDGTLVVTALEPN